MCKIKHKQYDEKQLNALIVNINDSKSFWSKLRAMTNRGRKVENNITTEEWVNHFEKLLNPVPENRNNDVNVMIEIDVNEQMDEIEDFIFNTDITEDEIRLAIKKFRKGKKPEPDCLLPEFFYLWY